VSAPLLLTLALAAAPADAPGAPVPAALRDVDVVEHLGAALPLETRWRDSAGRDLTLRQAIAADAPTLVVLAYYRCPMLCSLVLDGASRLVRALSAGGGPPFRIVTVSFDPRDTPGAATERRTRALGDAGLDGGSDAWPFLVGDEAPVQALLQAAGVTVRYDAATDQYAHAAVWLVVSPTGEISRYLYGIAPLPQQVEHALSEAAAGRTGTTLERLLMRCFAWDPAKRKLATTVQRFFAAGAAGILAAVGAVLAWGWRRERRRGAP
jgi:protein SCO1/2